SGLASQGIDVRAGIVDRSFHGEISILLINNTREAFSVKINDRIAQVIFQRIATQIELSEVDSFECLPKSVRGGNGFGSSGIATKAISLTGPVATSMQHKILSEAHVLGHYQGATLAAAVQAGGHEWDSLDNDAKAIADACPQCQAFSKKRTAYAPLMPITAKKLMDHIAIDLA
ncbi:hypothetical protein LPJ71_009620, partial [Coemansia sp. S17]